MKTTTNILSSAQAMQNCIKANNDVWLVKHEEHITNTLLDVLPHGSGIDCEWRFDFTDKAIFCYNSFHNMDDMGGYCGYTDFTVKIKIGHRDIFGKLDFSITGRFGRDQLLKDYLYETIDYALTEL
jgi:hypothetical protein